MTYMILDSTGSAINAFDDAVTARAALRAIVAEDPEAAAYVLLLAYDDGGSVVGPAVTFADLPAHTAEIAPTPFMTVTMTTACYSVAHRRAPALPSGLRRGNRAAPTAA